MLPFFCLLSILCFVVNNDFRQKKYQASDIQSYHPDGRDGMGLHWSFTIQSSSQMLLLFHVICFFKTGCFRCFKFSCFFHVICSIKTGCFRCFVFGYFFMSYMSHQNWLLQCLLYCCIGSCFQQSTNQTKNAAVTWKLMKLLDGTSDLFDLWNLIFDPSLIRDLFRKWSFDLWSLIRPEELIRSDLWSADLQSSRS